MDFDELALSDGIHSLKASSILLDHGGLL